MLSVDKIQSLVTSTAVTSDGEEPDDFNARRERREQANLLAKAIAEDVERAQEREMVEEYGARVAFAQVKEYEWTWEGEDPTQLDSAGEWKRSAHTNITSEFRARLAAQREWYLTFHFDCRRCKRIECFPLWARLSTCLWRLRF